MEWWQAVALGIVEGITEFLPISSTGHMILFSQWWGINQTEFVKSFEIIIQTGAIAAVAVEYGRRWWNDKEGLKRIAAGFVPTAMVGVVIYKLVKQYLLSQSWVVAVMLVVGAGGMVAAEELTKKRPTLGGTINRLSLTRAAGVGVWQAAAMVPGVSRSAATIIGGQALGLSRAAAVDLSFGLAVPTMLAATVLDMWESGWGWSAREWGLLGLGGVTAFLVARLTLRWLWRFVQRHDLRIFAVYRVLLAGWWLITQN